MNTWHSVHLTTPFPFRLLHPSSHLPVASHTMKWRVAIGQESKVDFGDSSNISEIQGGLLAREKCKWPVNASVETVTMDPWWRCHYLLGTSWNEALLLPLILSWLGLLCWDINVVFVITLVAWSKGEIDPTTVTRITEYYISYIKNKTIWIKIR